MIHHHHGFISYTPSIFAVALPVFCVSGLPSMGVNDLSSEDQLSGVTFVIPQNTGGIGSDG